MRPTGFEDAFDSVADAVARAAAIPDHRERKVTSPVVTHTSDLVEVTVTINDGKIQSIRLDESWLQVTGPDDVADLIARVTNAAMEEWAAQQLEAIQNVTPDMKELHAAIDEGRRKLQDAWVATLAEVRTP